jgi:hypothetical protein
MANEDGALSDDNEWEEYDDVEPISLGDLQAISLFNMPEDTRVHVLDNYFPDTTITREADSLVCRIEDHMYTKFWEHKFSAYAFAEAMERAIRRLVHEGNPFDGVERDDDDVHIFVRWNVRLPAETSVETVIDSIKTAYDLVCVRAESILEDSDSVLV